MAEDARADEVIKTLEFSWDYPAPPANLAGFKIFRVGITEPVFTISNPAALTHTGALYVSSTETCFTIAAYDTSNINGSMSEAYCVNLGYGGPPAPTNWHVVPIQ